MGYIPYFFLCFLIFSLWVRNKSRKANNEQSEKDKAFWERERASNFVRKKDISDLPFIEIPLDELPFSETSSPEIKEIQEKLRQDATKKMINLTGMSNTDIKMEYGAANLPFLSEYDQNCTVLLRDIFTWGRLLKEEGSIPEARKVLEYGISLKSDITGNYILLAEIYRDCGEIEKIQDLIDEAATLHTMMKEQIIQKLKAILHSYQ